MSPGNETEIQSNLTSIQGTSIYTLQIYTAGIGTHVKSVKFTSICHRYYHVKV